MGQKEVSGYGYKAKKICSVMRKKKIVSLILVSCDFLSNLLLKYFKSKYLL